MRFAERIFRPLTWRFLFWGLGLLFGAIIHHRVFAEIDGSQYAQPMSIFIANLLGSSTRENHVGSNLATIISADLERSGVFRPITSQKFDVLTATGQPRFFNLHVLKAQALISGHVGIQLNGDIKAVVFLWNVSDQKILISQTFCEHANHWRRIAHAVADTVYLHFTKVKGYFNTRIAYISESGEYIKRVKRLAIMDQDGANHQYLSDGSWLVLTPRFSPTMQEITYMSYFRNVPRVYLFDLQMGQRKLLGSFPGMTFAPRFSPDGRKLIMSMSKKGNTDIYEIDLRTQTVQQLTNHPAIDTSPSYSSDGLRITFNSDRSGTQQIYVMNKDGSDIQRISFGDGRYATSVWSPSGNLIAFTKFTRGRFYIGVMKSDGSCERQLAEGFLVESPTWAPNGRMLMFCREISRDVHGRGGSTRLYSVDLTGYNERLVPTPQDASDPAWSPLQQ